ncbi:uncharacterized protein OCT59_002056 [Rhizophagus irregularis]|uniref:Uncharacterized protein n=3 Tax=Rhizophagus irregularis TaxID=588596 RepID=A0A915ZH55_9GLOM|nr:hypothetical protein RirG_123340 [Rhizophagus irregularis DAOM 197198w]UZO10475.1 hypothetical protein OCT59_002056 [Rhizophagus irregularis]GET66385.1 hypothetical protein GLOIN_2v1701693 [Rhizophagus irregularis DAOM 181602=DAOM 197198]CAB4481547.1 unnamed protein product [Rhizophagus irregularis]CAB5111695.1 unnamed protein product [Rhizophagus irregularis]
MLISKFERKEFFNHKFSANDLFNRLYNVSHRKSPPTCFILLKTVLGLIAKDEDIKVVGMLQSVLAAAILRAADRYEFMNLCLEVRQLYDTNIIASLDAYTRPDIPSYNQ